MLGLVLDRDMLFHERAVQGVLEELPQVGDWHDTAHLSHRP